jgi:hypothetical protein
MGKIEGSIVDYLRFLIGYQSLVAAVLGNKTIFVVLFVHSLWGVTFVFVVLFELLPFLAFLALAFGFLGFGFLAILALAFCFLCFLCFLCFGFLLSLPFRGTFGTLATLE